MAQIEKSLFDACRVAVRVDKSLDACVKVRKLLLRPPLHSFEIRHFVDQLPGAEDRHEQFFKACIGRDCFLPGRVRGIDDFHRLSKPKILVINCIGDEFIALRIAPHLKHSGNRDLRGLLGQFNLVLQ